VYRLSQPDYLVKAAVPWGSRPSGLEPPSEIVNVSVAGNFVLIVYRSGAMRVMDTGRRTPLPKAQVSTADWQIGDCVLYSEVSRPCFELEHSG
jgi:hypothetical protein